MSAAPRPWLAIFLAAMCLVSVSAICTVTGHTAQAQEAPSKKRGPPPPPPSLVLRGVRYEAVPAGARPDLDPDAGYVAAIDLATARELWVARIYGGLDTPDIEDDKRAVFIRRLLITDHGRALMVIDERDRRYRLDLATRAVTSSKAQP